MDVSHSESDMQLVREWLYFSSCMKRRGMKVQDAQAVLIGKDKSCSLQFYQAFVKALGYVQKMQFLFFFFFFTAI